MSDTTTLIATVDDIVERAEMTEKSSKRIKKDKIQFLNTDNSWNRDGILDAFDDSEDEMTYCTASGVPLFYISQDGRRFDLESYGYCALNGKPYHRDHLKMSDDVGRSSYPIIYEGCYSLEEHAKPLTEEELTELRREYGI